MKEKLPHLALATSLAFSGASCTDQSFETNRFEPVNELVDEYGCGNSLATAYNLTSTDDGGTAIEVGPGYIYMDGEGLTLEVMEKEAPQLYVKACKPAQAIVLEQELILDEDRGLAMTFHQGFTIGLLDTQTGQQTVWNEFEEALILKISKENNSDTSPVLIPDPERLINTIDRILNDADISLEELVRIHNGRNGLIHTITLLIGTEDVYPHDILNFMDRFSPVNDPSV